MPSLRPGLAWLSVLVLAGTASLARADAPPDPLRLVPAQADVVFKIEDPRRLVETFTSLAAVKQTLELEVVREYYDSTNVRRLFQFLAYFEKKLGAGRMELLDRLAGGGAVLAVKAGEDAPVLLVVQAKDEKLLHEFVKVAQEAATQELTRLEGKDRLEKFSHAGVQGVHLGKKVFIAAAGSALLVSNKEEAMNLALDLHAGKGKSVAANPGIAEARKLLPPRPLAWTWVNLESVRNVKQVKDAIPTIELNAVLGPFVGTWFDTAKRAPFLCTSLSHEGGTFLATLRLPRGLDGMSEKAAIYLPREHDASPPLLVPRDVQYSATYYLDLGRLWEKRDKVLTKEALDGLNKAEKQAARFLGGIQLGKLLSQTGSHQRFMQVSPSGPSTVYKRQPKQPFGSFALVQEMRDPAFAKSMESILRTAALLGAFQVNLKQVEEKHAGYRIVTYLFPEDGKFPGDVQDIRFSFSPSFTQVGDQFVVASTVELARELVDLLHKEAGSKSEDPASVRVRVYAAGVAASLRLAQEQLLTQAILGQALSPKAAQEQVNSLIRIVAGLGNMDVMTSYGRNDYRLDVRFSLGK
jgi:hypothetical protein